VFLFSPCFYDNAGLYLFDCSLWFVLRVACCELRVVEVGSSLAGMMAFTLTLAHDENIGM